MMANIIQHSLCTNATRFLLPPGEGQDEGARDWRMANAKGNLAQEIFRTVVLPDPQLTRYIPSS